MRKHVFRLIMLLLVLGLLPCMPALSEAEDPILLQARTMAEEALDELRADATGWVAVMLADAEITTVEYGNKSVYVRISAPTLAAGVTSRREAGDDLAGYLTEAFTPYVERSDTMELLLNAQYTQKKGEVTMKWSGVSNPRNLLSKLKGQASTSKKVYACKQMRLALGRWLLPKTAEMPRKQPEEAVALAELPDYAAQVAPALSLTEEQAALRLPSLLMLMELTEVDTTAPLDTTVLTVKVRDWNTMLDNAFTAAKTQMEQMVGTPDMERIELERILCAELPAAMTAVYYKKGGITEETMTVDLAKAALEGAGQASGLMAYFVGYNQKIESLLDEMAAYAMTLPYYPRVEPINSQVLTGAEETQGNRVSFDMGSDTENSAYVRVKRDGQTVLTGFVRHGVRLTVRLTPGDYTVDYSTGPEWYGNDYLFGKEAFFGTFELTVTDAARTIVHLTGDGDVPVTTVDADTFMEGNR